MNEVERFVVLLYNRTSDPSCVNEARKRMFAFNNREIHHIPPTRAALKQHVKRSAYQAGLAWGEAFLADPLVP